MGSYICTWDAHIDFIALKSSSIFDNYTERNHLLGSLVGQEDGEEKEHRTTMETNS